MGEKALTPEHPEVAARELGEAVWKSTRPTSLLDAEPMFVGRASASGERNPFAGVEEHQMRWNSLPVFEDWFDSQTYGVRPWNRPRPPRTCWRSRDRGGGGQVAG